MATSSTRKRLTVAVTRAREDGRAGVHDERKAALFERPVDPPQLGKPAREVIVRSEEWMRRVDLDPSQTQPVGEPSDLGLRVRVVRADPSDRDQPVGVGLHVLAHEVVGPFGVADHQGAHVVDQDRALDARAVEKLEEAARVTQAIDGDRSSRVSNARASGRISSIGLMWTWQSVIPIEPRDPGRGISPTAATPRLQPYLGRFRSGLNRWRTTST